VADVSLTPEQELLRTAARDFVEREWSLPATREFVAGESEFPQELWSKMVSLGWAGILVPQEYGGEGGSLTDAAVLCEELGRGLVPGPFHSSALLCTLAVLHGGTDELKRRVLPVLAAGDHVFAFAQTEESGDWSLQSIRTTATPAGGGHRISGLKQYIHDAGNATDLLVVAQANGGIGCFIVPAPRGVITHRMHGFSGDPLFEVVLDDVAVRAEDMLDLDRVQLAVDRATALLCAYVAGASRRVYEMTMDYARHRVQFGQSIARFQRVQDRLIEMLNSADATRWTAYEAIWRLENGKPGAAEAVSVAKAVASEGFYRLCEDAHHVHAGVGSDKAYGLYLFTQKSRSFYHYMGNPAYHRERLSRLLGLSGPTEPSF
jgi:alkylation response protein AidB-like acyl-CoA dehydrogenase